MLFSFFIRLRCVSFSYLLFWDPRWFVSFMLICYNYCRNSLQSLNNKSCLFSPWNLVFFFPLKAYYLCISIECTFFGILLFFLWRPAIHLFLWSAHFFFSFFSLLWFYMFSCIDFYSWTFFFFFFLLNSCRRDSRGLTNISMAVELILWWSLSCLQF